MAITWQPSASVEVLKQRAKLLKQIRDFMAARDILEVETPILSHAGNTDPNLNSFTIQFHSPTSADPQRLYLHTSPEFAMKRLLTAGSGSIFQIVRVFRDQELGRWHQPEFTMLEWYRTGFDHIKLMDEMTELMLALGLKGPVRTSYATVFERATGIDPHRGATAQLQDKAASQGLHGDENDRPVLLDFLFSKLVAPGLGIVVPELIYDFPSCQAALSRIRNDDPPVAERFELFIGGVEIANGFHELRDAGEQQRRFELENLYRRQRNMPEVPVDRRFLAALEQGMPDCAGVALGIDRLLMVVLGYDSIDKVVTFTFNQA